MLWPSCYPKLPPSALIESSFAATVLASLDLTTTVESFNTFSLAYRKLSPVQPPTFVREQRKQNHQSMIQMHQLRLACSGFLQKSG